jgi:membrane protease YdiL (CAAX protease family)
MQFVLALLFPAILLGSFWCWVHGLQRIWQGLPLLVREPRRQVPWDFLDLVLTLIFLSATQTAAALIVQRWLQLEAGTAPDQLSIAARGTLILCGSLATLAAFALSLLTVWLRSKASWRDLGICGNRLLGDIGLGVAGFVMLAPPIYLLQFVLVQWFESKHPLIELLKQQPQAKFFVLSGFAAVLVAPLVEEYLFRLLLQGWLEKIFAFGGRRGWISTFEDPVESEAPAAPWTDGSPESSRQLGKDTAANDKPGRGIIVESHTDPRPPQPPAFEPPSSPARQGETWLASVGPIVISSLLFALLHFNHGPDWVPLFVLALGLGYLYNRTHRLVPCITVHFLLNALTLLALLAEVYQGG